MCASLRPSMACEDFWKALSSWFCRTTNKFLSEMAYQTQPGLLASLHHTKNCQQDTPKSRTQAGVGWGLQKICGAMDGGTEAPQGLSRALMKRSFMRQLSEIGRASCRERV